MALVSLLGFQDWAVGPVSSNITPSAVSMMPVDSSVYGVGTVLQTFFASAPTKIIQFTDSRGVARKGIGGASSVAPYLQYSSTYLQAIPRTGKWYFGIRYYGSQAIQVQASVRLSNNAATTWTPTANIAATVLYFEVVVDWVAKTMDLYVNKVKVGSGVADPASTITNWLWRFGSTYTVGADWCWTDMYWVVEGPSEPNPLGGPLGPIFVERASITSVDNSQLFTPPGSLSVGDQWNTNAVTPAYTGSSNVANAVTTSPHGEVASVHFKQPTETAPILAVSWNLSSTRASSANAGTVSQVVDGANTLPQTKEVPAVTTSISVNQFGSTKALDGTAWTPEAVARTVLKVGSYRP